MYITLEEKKGLGPFTSALCKIPAEFALLEARAPTPTPDLAFLTVDA